MRPADQDATNAFARYKLIVVASTQRGNDHTTTLLLIVINELDASIVAGT
jgi:hypothetical protein